MKPGLDYIGVSTPFYCHDGQGNFLFHKRTNNCRDEKGRWDNGSGQLEQQLSISENVLKEVQEEYGCKGVIEEQLPPLDIFREEEGIKTHWLAIPFIIRVKREEIKNNEPDHISEIGWFKLDNLPQPLHQGSAYTLNKYQEYFKKYS
jgi:8-oxo-dGTP diphosphatase